MRTKLIFETLQTKGFVLRSLAFNPQRRKTDPTELFGLIPNRVPIDRLVQEKLGYVPILLPVVGSPDSLFAIVRTVFELVIELYVSNGNEYQH